jgi:hypothetical protein
MIRNLFLSISIIAAVPATAQETAQIIPLPPAERKHEIGLFSQSVISNGNMIGQLNMMGVQYKNWVKPNKAYRTLVSYAQYSVSDMQPSNKTGNADTVFTNFYNTQVPMAFIGAGVEMQRHFYKKVYLFAALELRGGTGNGVVETFEQSQPKQQGTTYYNGGNSTLLSSNNVSMTYVGFVPSIGGKFLFNRVSFGVEVSPIEMAYKSTTTNGVRTGITDFNLGTLSNRFFFSFRF